MTVKNLEPKHWEAVKRIYQSGIDTGNATFEKTIPDWAIWDKNHLTHSRLICEIDGKIAGWVALSPVSDRCAYGNSAEVSIYIDFDYQGLGIGFVLLEHLVIESENNGIWTLQSGIFETNKASIRLHEKSGYRKIGYRERISKLDGVWHNIVLFEKRSKRIGI